MLDFDINERCYGCEACKNVCPQKAITMKENKDGFLIPVINQELCIKCGLCQKKCIYLSFEEKKECQKDCKMYLAYRENSKERKNSASGGIFYALAETIIKKQGFVCGVIWNNKMEAIHKVTNDIEIVKKMRGSKYVQSRMEDSFKQIGELLKLKKLVLFSGTPCQVASVKSIFGDNENLLTCAIVCEGVPSPKVWKRYKEYIEEKYKSKIKNVNFKNKDKTGWLHPNVEYEFENGKKIKKLAYEEDIYGIAFIQNLFNRKSCSNCQYKGDAINADIVIGDFWGAKYDYIKKTENTGISIMIVKSEKVKKIIDESTVNIVKKEIDKKQIIRRNEMIIKSAKKNKRSNQFFNNMNKIDIDRNIKANIEINTKKVKLKKFLLKTNMYPIFLKIKNKLKGEE